MLINLPDEIADHLQRVKALAIEAAEDDEQSFGARTTPMNALSALLRELTKTQEEVQNMERLLQVEKTLIDVVKDALTEEKLEHLLKVLEDRLAEL